jgi:hypothetical protein
MKPDHRPRVVGTPFTTKLGRSRIAPTGSIPAGLRVIHLPDPQGGRYVLNEFPETLFPKNSLERHDAEHYGITVPDECVGFPPPTYRAVSKLWLTHVQPEFRERHGNYSFLVRQDARAYTAMRTAAALEAWARRRNIQLPPHCTRDYDTWDLSCQFGDGMVWSTDELNALQGERFWALSNGRYTLHVAEQLPCGTVVVWHCNPNVPYRLECADYRTMQEAEDAGA